MVIFTDRKHETVSGFQREVLVQNARFLIDFAPQIHYAEIRPMATRKIDTMADVRRLLGQGDQLTMDCSEAVTSLFRWSGLRDPNGLGYNGLGYTGTMYKHLPHYFRIADAKPGALLIFGAPVTTHVCMLMETGGSNPWLFSHGSEIGPLHIRLDDERTAHTSETETWLDIAHL